MVAAASAQFLVIVDESKQVQKLGIHSPLPVEVLPFGWRTHLAPLTQLGCEPRLRLRSDGTPTSAITATSSLIATSPMASTMRLHSLLR